MKTQSKLNIELVDALAKCIEMRKIAEKREKQLKEEVRRIMGTASVLEAGAYAVAVGQRTKSSLNASALKDYLGDKITMFMQSTQYEVMEVYALENRSTT